MSESFKPFFKYIRAFERSKNTVEVPKEVFLKVITYMENDETREWNARCLGDAEDFYVDGEYYWSNKVIDKIKNGEYCFADGFVEHVLKRLEENNG